MWGLFPAGSWLSRGLSAQVVRGGGGGVNPPPARPHNPKKVHVNKILPRPSGLLGATWRLAPSHQLIGALDPPAVTSVSAPNTRSLIFVHGGSPKGAGIKGGLDSSRFLAGFQPAAPAGAGGARGGAFRGGQKDASKGLAVHSSSCRL
jgi:hypothetical protein